MTQERILSVLRNIFTIVGGYLIGKSLFGAAIDENLLELIIGAVLSIVGTIWSIVDKTVTVEKIQGTVRHIVSILGGVFVATGRWSPENLEFWSGVLLALVPIIQGYFSRVKVRQVQEGAISVQQLKAK